MTGVKRGLVLWHVDGSAVVEVVVLDRSPDGWWVKGVGERDARNVKPTSLFGNAHEARKAAAA